MVKIKYAVEEYYPVYEFYKHKDGVEVDAELFNAWRDAKAVEEYLYGLLCDEFKANGGELKY